MPLTWLSFALDYQWGGLNPMTYHLGNLILHCLNTLLVFFLCFRLLNLINLKADPPDGNFPKNIAMPAALITALLFGLHPIHVEPIAWATERKDVLCSLFFLLSLQAYLGYVSTGGKKTYKYYASLGYFLLSLMAKPMAVTLPLVLLLLDAWPLKRLIPNRTKIFLEKTPFLLASLLSGSLAVAGQTQMGSIANLQTLSLPYRLLNALHSLVFYLVKVFAPFHLSVFYPLPTTSQVFSLEYLLSGLLVIIISFVCFFYRKKHPYLATVWLFYLVTIAPVAGVFQSGIQAAANRYAYVPILGFLLLFASFSVFLFSNRLVLLGLFILTLTGFLGYGTINQVGIWKNSLVLWENAAREYPGVSLKIQLNLGESYAKEGRLDDALKEYDKGIATLPQMSALYNGRGVILASMGRRDEAVRDFMQAVSLDPLAATPHRNLWNIYERGGNRNVALAEISEAIKLEPDSALNYNYLGKTYGMMNRLKEAQAAFLKAINLDPFNTEYLVNLAISWQGIGKNDEAIACYKQGIDNHPHEPIFYLNLGKVYMSMGLFPQAIETLLNASNLWPGNTEIAQILGEAYQKAGQHDLARQYLEKAQALRGGIGNR